MVTKIKLLLVTIVSLWRQCHSTPPYRVNQPSSGYGPPVNDYLPPPTEPPNEYLPPPPEPHNDYLPPPPLVTTPSPPPPQTTTTAAPTVPPPSPVIGEEVVECHDEPMTVVDTVMVDMVMEECDTIETSECETEYTEECEDVPGDCDDPEPRCDTVMLEVCAEVTNQVTDDGEDCVTLYRDDCESHWVGEGTSRVNGKQMKNIFLHF